MLHDCHFREAIRMAMSLAQEVNRYLDDKAPWKAIKQDRQGAATACYVALEAISCLKTVLYPFLPFSSQKLHRMLGFQGAVDQAGWNIQQLAPGKELPQPEPLFIKLEDSIVEEETSKLVLSRS